MLPVIHHFLEYVTWLKQFIDIFFFSLSFKKLGFWIVSKTDTFTQKYSLRIYLYSFTSWSNARLLRQFCAKTDTHGSFLIWIKSMVLVLAVVKTVSLWKFQTSDISLFNLFQKNKWQYWSLKRVYRTWGLTGLI